MIYGNSDEAFRRAVRYRRLARLILWGFPVTLLGLLAWGDVSAYRNGPIFTPDWNPTVFEGLAVLATIGLGTIFVFVFVCMAWEWACDHKDV